MNSLEMRQELAVEERLRLIEADLEKLQKQFTTVLEDVDLAISYSRAIALELIGAERLAVLEARAKKRDERLRT